MQVTKKMLKAFKGKPTIIAVAPGDYGSKYFPLEGWQKAHNRALDERHRNRLLKDWNLELAGLVTLVVNETGDKIFIIDGQHRIAACSMMDDPQILLARIYTFDEIPMSVENWVTEINAIPAYPVDTTGLDLPELQAFAFAIVEEYADSMGYNIDVLTPANYNKVMWDGFAAVLAGTKTAEEQMLDLEAAMQEAIEAGDVLDITP